MDRSILAFVPKVSAIQGPSSSTERVEREKIFTLDGRVVDFVCVVPRWEGRKKQENKKKTDNC